MRFDEVNLTNANDFHTYFLKFVRSQWQTFIKKYIIRDDSALSCEEVEILFDEIVQKLFKESNSRVIFFIYEYIFFLKLTFNSKNFRILDGSCLFIGAELGNKKK